MRGLICGPKCAACGLVLSVWGVIMLSLLGIFFTTHSAVLIEDVPVKKEDIHQDANPPHRIYDLYNKVGNNCFIAAAIYLVVGAFSCCQMRLNKQKEVGKQLVALKKRMLFVMELRLGGNIGQGDKSLPVQVEENWHGRQEHHGV
uniref:ribonuclease kappa-A-like isoform X2 n=1 Tax=Solea senegalensis TaxID=28829 RepID=UPI001CD8B88D|nr:ribonuclease kappa-A-like isoform X2 [Solea senegalensis]